MKPKAIISIHKHFEGQVFTESEISTIAGLTDLAGVYMDAEAVRKDETLLRELQVVFAGWGSIAADTDFLAKAPNFKAMFGACGSVRPITSEAFWERDDLIVTSAAHANAIPVAEYCLSTILFSLKLGWRHIRRTRAERSWQWEPSVPGGFRSTVGLVSLGEIGRKTLELLRPFDLDVCVYSTSMSEEKARELGVRRLSLEDLFAQADVISVHTPDLPATKGMIHGGLLERMKPDATLINSARGAVIDQDALLEVWKARPDLTAVLDVVLPDPPPPESKLYDYENIVLTPHIAGSMYGETRRLAQYTIDACREFLDGKTPEHTVTKKQFERMA
jgi:phosphoglycerate dehydrogenase-like enzyme